MIGSMLMRLSKLGESFLLVCFGVWDGRDKRGGMARDLAEGEG
jgi:hypothetical protein